MRPGSLFTFLLAVVGLTPLAPVLSAQSHDGTAIDTARPVAVKPLALAIVGASVSAGFVDGPLTGGSPDNRTVPLQNVLRGWLREAAGEVRTAADLFFFQDPVEKGQLQVDRTLSGESDLVVAIDFLFWYGYGYMSGPGDERAQRLARLELGLAQLDRLQCPVLLGDLPDMKGAARRMISPRQIPDEASLTALNARIVAWAGERPRMHLFELRGLVTSMKEEGLELDLEDGKVKVPPGGLLQGDRLHANRLGMAYLGHILQERIGGALGDRGRELPRWGLDEFVELTRAGEEVENLLDQQQAAAGSRQRDK